MFISCLLTAAVLRKKWRVQLLFSATFIFAFFSLRVSSLFFRCMFYPLQVCLAVRIRALPVHLSSVTFVRPAQRVELLGNIFTA